jgi:hypothetical protein
MPFRYEEEMYPYVWRNLRNKYPTAAGWEIRNQDIWEGIRIDFVCERRSRGRIERVVCDAKCRERVNMDDINQINDYCRCLAGGNAIIREKILAIPSHSRISVNIKNTIKRNNIQLMILRG